MRLFKFIFIICAFIFGAVPISQAADLLLLEQFEFAALTEDYKNLSELGESLLSKERSNSDAAQMVQYEVAISQLHLKNYVKARNMLTQLRADVREGYQQDKIDLALFDSYYLSENYPEAQTIIDKMLAARSKSDWLSGIEFRAARVYLKQAQWDKARLLFAKIMNELPTSLEVDYARQLLEEEQYFTVQVGSFNARERAEQMTAEIKNRGEYAYIVETLDKSGAKYYRVRVGRLSTLNDAQQMKKRLLDMGYPSAKIYP